VTRVTPGAEPFIFHGGPIGVLLLHGFTGNPAAMRRIGEWLAARGHTVSCPRYPGHGTSWKELGRTRWQDWAAEASRGLKEIDRRCESVVLLGLSVGGAMALYLAARYPDVVRAVALVNPFVRDRRIMAVPYVWRVIPTQKGVGNDIKRPGEDELPYDRIPAHAIAELARLLKMVQSGLPRVHQPLLVFNSPEDHVVPKGNAAYVLDRVGSTDKELVELSNSYHVATLDHDAELIFERTHEFAEAKAPAAHRANGLGDDEPNQEPDEAPTSSAD
jgi:carboxylesterase